MSSEKEMAPSAAHAEGLEQIEKQQHSILDCAAYKGKSFREVALGGAAHIAPLSTGAPSLHAYLERIGARLTSFRRAVVEGEQEYGKRRRSSRSRLTALNALWKSTSQPMSSWRRSRPN
jgi:hypothetical protein